MFKFEFKYIVAFFTVHIFTQGLVMTTMGSQVTPTTPPPLPSPPPRLPAPPQGL